LYQQKRDSYSAVCNGNLLVDKSYKPKGNEGYVTDDAVNTAHTADEYVNVCGIKQDAGDHNMFDVF